VAASLERPGCSTRADVLQNSSERSNAVPPTDPKRWLAPPVTFVIRLASRAMTIAGIVPEPSRPWMKQTVRSLTDRWAGFLKGFRDLVHDRSPLFTAMFESILQRVGMQ